MKKKIIGVAAAVMIAVLLVGCGNSATATNRDLNEMKVERYVTLGDYNNLSISVAPQAEVGQEEWNELMLAVYQSYVTEDNGAVTNRAVEMGDTVVIDYVGTKDGVAFGGGTASNAKLTIGSGEFIDGFEDGLIGARPGETVELNLSFPEGFRQNAELAGQAVVFTVTVDYIFPTLDEMEDSVVASLGVEDVSTVDELWQYVYDYLQDNVEEAYLYSLQNAIIEHLLDQTTIDELPQTFVESYNHVFQDNLDRIAAGYGVSAEILVSSYGMDLESYISLYSEVQARQEILLQAIANREGLTVSDEELQEALEEYAAEDGYATVEEWLGDYDREEYRNYIMCDKVMEYLIGIADIKNE